MANKRLIKVEDNDFNPRKRRCGKGGTGVKIGSSVSSHGQKLQTKKANPFLESSTVIDLSGDVDGGAYVTNPKIFMKPLPPALDRSRFPRFADGVVYIIVHAQNQDYQYKLHKAILSAVSAPLQGLLFSQKDELDDALKASSTNAEVRIELVYNSNKGDWTLAKKTFTDFETDISWSDTKSFNAVFTKPPSFGSGVGAASLQLLELCGSEAAIASQSVRSISNYSTPSALSTPVKNVNNVSSNENICALDEPHHQQKAAIEERATSVPNQPIGNHFPTADALVVESNPFPNEGSLAINASHASGTVEGCLNLVQQESDTLKQQLNAMNQESGVIEKQLGVNESFSEQNNIKIDMKETAGTWNDGARPVELDVANISMTETSLSQANEAGDAKKIDQVNFSNQNITTNISDQGNRVCQSHEDNQTTQASEDNQIGASEIGNASQDSQINEVIEVHEITHNIPNEHRSETCGAESNLSTKLPAPVAKSIDPIQIDIPTEPPIELCEAYNNLFLIFYRIQPKISKICISIALQQCEAVLALAVRLGSLPTVRPYLGAAISQFGKDLYLSVMAEPFRWLKLSVGLHNDSIFREAMIHIAGACHTVPRGLDDHNYIPADLPPSVRRLIMRKISQLDLWKLQVNETLFMSTIRIGEDIVALSPQSTSAFPTWLVVQVWRDWFCSQLIRYQDQPQRMGKLYRTLTKGGDSYLPLEELQDILGVLTQPYDAKMLEADLKIMKHAAKEITKELCENKSILHVDEVALDYLTSTWVDSEELPWNLESNGK